MREPGHIPANELPFPCPVCGSRLNGPTIAREASLRGEVAIRRCPKCSLHLTWPRLAEPQGEYQGTTAEGWEAKYGAIARGERLHDRHQNYLEEVAVIRQYAPHGRLLDVGCNAGWLLRYLQLAGDYELEGVEPSPVLAEIARRRLGVPIHNGYLHQVQDRDEAFDGLIAADVIEHIFPEAANAFLQAIARLLKRGGYVFVKTPNAHFTAMKYRLTTRMPHFVRRFALKGQDVWDAKEHLIHWDVSNLRRMFTQHGLTPVKTFVPRPVETASSPLGARLARKAIYTAARTLGGRRGAPPFAQDIFVVARRESESGLNRGSR